MRPVREYIREAKARGLGVKGIKAEDVRGLQTKDFFGNKGGPREFQHDLDIDEELSASRKKTKSRSRQQAQPESTAEPEWVDEEEGDGETFNEAEEQLQ